MPKPKGTKHSEESLDLDIEVFKTGTITDSSGDTKEWTQEDLETIASTYNDAIAEDESAEAPVVKGHPETNEPALGWVKKLSVVGDKLKASIKLVESFAKEVKEEMYKKVSIALYEDLMLRHIGFLGAVPPAVKGLEPVKFERRDKFKAYKFEETPFDIETMDFANYPWNQCISDMQGQGHSKDSAQKICAAIKNRTVTHAQEFNKLPTKQAAIDFVIQKYTDDKLFNYQLERFAELEANKFAQENPTPNDSLEAFKAAQLERSKLYGIGVKDKIGYIQKPDAYKDLTDDQFGDPVNYLYPLHDLPNIMASKNAYRPWDNSYSEVEQQVIQARFLKALEAQGVSLLDNEGRPIYFAEFNQGIKLNDKLKKEKPAIYAEHRDGDFGDPVHYRFPLKTLSEVKASVAIFNRLNVRNQYSEPEQHYIARRIILAAKSYNMNLKGDTWSFVDIPPDQLTKKQLIDVVNKQTNKDSFQTNPKGNTMEQWFSDFIAAMVQKISENVNEETATQFQTWVDEYKAATPMPAVTPPAPVTNASETPEFSEAKKRIDILEKENRDMKFNAYIASQNKRIVPAQKPLILSALEWAEKQPHALEFTEAPKDGKAGKNVKLQGAGVIQAVVESFPEQVEFEEFAKDGRKTEKEGTTTFNAPEDAEVNEERLTLHNKALEYQEEQQKLGKTISYAQAVIAVSKK